MLLLTVDDVSVKLTERAGRSRAAARAKIDDSRFVMFVCMMNNNSILVWLLVGKEVFSWPSKN